jgi:hypothetical protein
MTLTVEQRAELEALGPATVRFKLLQGSSDRGAAARRAESRDVRGRRSMKPLYHRRRARESRP